MKRITTPYKINEELRDRISRVIQGAKVGEHIVIKITKDKPVVAPLKEPLSKQDLETLRQRGDALAKSIKELGDANMAASTKQLRGLQWYESAQQRVYGWDQYIRFLERDGILDHPTRDSIGE